MARPHKKVSHKPVSKKAPTKNISRSPKRDPFAGVSPKLSALLRKHFTEKGRAERIARAEKAWQKAVEIASTFKNIDDETWKLIAQSKELEDV